MFRVRVIFQCLAGTQARNPQLAANFGLLSASGKPGGSKSKPYCRAGSRCFRIRVKSLPRPAAGPGGRPTAGLRRRPWSLMPDSESPLRATVLKLLLGVTVEAAAADLIPSGELGLIQIRSTASWFLFYFDKVVPFSLHLSGAGSPALRRQWSCLGRGLGVRAAAGSIARLSRVLIALCIKYQFVQDSEILCCIC